jgi:hypothetical protein
LLRNPTSPRKRGEVITVRRICAIMSPLTMEPQILHNRHQILAMASP